jgi:uncharacterized protein YdaU (DUF1376 family)
MTLPFYPFYWGDYSSKTFDLTQGQHGAYMLFLRYIYCTGNRIPDKERYSIAKASLSPEKATLSGKSIEQENADFILAAFFHKKNGFWYNKRAEEVMNGQHERRQALVEAGRRGGRPRKATLNPPFPPEKARPKQPEPEPEPIEEEGTNVPSRVPVQEKLDEATSRAVTTSWNLLAAEVGLAQVQILSETRRRALPLRLKEIGGLVGWYAMCDKIRASPFLTGQSSSWKCSFDWVINPKNLIKIMEGNYDDKKAQPGQISDSERAEIARRLRA